MTWRERVGGSPSVPATTLWVSKVLDSTGRFAQRATKAKRNRRPLLSDSEWLNGVVVALTMVPRRAG